MVLSSSANQDIVDLLKEKQLRMKSSIIMKSGWISVVLSLFALLLADATSAQPASPRAPHEAPGLDGHFIRLASKLPGFGGYFFDENGDLNVYLTDVAREPEARALLAEAAATRPQRWRQPWTRPAQIIVRHGQFDFPEWCIRTPLTASRLARQASIRHHTAARRKARPMGPFIHKGQVARELGMKCMTPHYTLMRLTL